MANTYSQSQLNIKTPKGGFQRGGWYEGRQYWDGTFSDPGVIHPMSDQQGSGQLVSAEVNLQSDKAQGNKPGDIEKYLQQQRQVQAQQNIRPTVSASQTGIFGSGYSSGTSASLPEMQVQPTINLPELQKTLFTNSGIAEKEASLVDLEGKYLEAKGKISDNPFLSASQLDQRLQRLQRKYEEETAPIRSEIAMKKADIETQLNLQMKQFDINSQASRDALNYFNTLLDSGALNGASGEMIAQVTRATGIPGELLMNAVKSSTNKNTQLIQSTADNGEVTVSLVNKDTGAIINQQSLGLIGNAQTGGSGSSAKVSEQEIMATLVEDVRSGKPLIDYSGSGGGDILSAYTGWLDPNKILQIYNANSPYGEAKESAEDLAKYGVK